MLRLVVAVLLAGQGLIHLIGAAKAFRLADLRAAGWLWLVAAGLLIIAAALRLLRKDSWWMVAVPAVVLSQAPIVTAWGNAKFGTVANLVILGLAVVGFGRWRFSGLVRGEQASLVAAAVAQPTPVTSESLDNLPPIVRRWLEHSNAIGKPIPRLARLRQRGAMRTKPNGKWMPFEAEQLVSLGNPAFIWSTEIAAAPLVHIAGRDKYANGRGNMLIKLWSLFPIADAKGPETDQGTLVRFLAELSWFPTAALSGYLQWEQVDSSSAKATMTFEGIMASGIFRFNPDADMVSFEAKRFYVGSGSASLEDRFVAMTGWKQFAGVRIPHRSEVSWKLKAGDHQWLRLEITAIVFDERY